MRGDAMKTVEYLFTPGLAPMFWPGIIAATVIALLCAPLSPLVVLKKLSFVGQGVSHAAFGGVGLTLYGAALLGVGGWNPIMQACVACFAVAAGLWIAVLSRRRGTDTAIGIVLAVCMAIGFVFYRLAADRSTQRGLPPPPGIEDVLFGSVLGVGPAGASITALAALAVLAALWWIRRPLLAWAFDESTAGSFGVNGERMRAALLVMLSVAVVATMQVAGVVLATALLVLPGAIGLRLSTNLRTVVAASLAAALAGVLGGLVVSFEFGTQAGPSIVLTLAGLFMLTRGLPPRYDRGATRRTP